MLFRSSQDPADFKANPATRSYDRCFVLSTSGNSLPAIPFILTSSLPPAGLYRLDYLYVGFTQVNPHFKGGVIPTATGQVNGTSSTPGACKEYRNGAFVLQAVSDLPTTLYRIESTTNDPSMPTWCASKYGGVFGPSSGLGKIGRAHV